MKDVSKLKEGDSIDVIYYGKLRKANIRRNWPGLKRISIEIDIPNIFGKIIKVVNVDLDYGSFTLNALDLNKAKEKEETEKRQKKHQAPPTRDENIEKPYCPMDDLLKRQRESNILMRRSKQIKINVELAKLTRGDQTSIFFENKTITAKVAENWPEVEVIMLEIEPESQPDTTLYIPCHYNNKVVLSPFKTRRQNNHPDPTYRGNLVNKVNGKKSKAEKQERKLNQLEKHYKAFCKNRKLNKAEYTFNTFLKDINQFPKEVTDEISETMSDLRDSSLLGNLLGVFFTLAGGVLKDDENRSKTA